MPTPQELQEYNGYLNYLDFLDFQDAQDTQDAQAQPSESLGQLALRGAGEGALGVIKSPVTVPLAVGEGIYNLGTGIGQAAAGGSLEPLQQSLKGVGEVSSGTAGLLAGGSAGAALGAFGGPVAPVTVPLGAAIGGAIGYGAGKLGFNKVLQGIGAEPPSTPEQDVRGLVYDVPSALTGIGTAGAITGSARGLAQGVRNIPKVGQERFQKLTKRPEIAKRLDPEDVASSQALRPIMSETTNPSKVSFHKRLREARDEFGYLDDIEGPNAAAKLADKVRADLTTKQTVQDTLPDGRVVSRDVRVTGRLSKEIGDAIDELAARENIPDIVAEAPGLYKPRFGREGTTIPLSGKSFAKPLTLDEVVSRVKQLEKEFIEGAPSKGIPSTKGVIDPAEIRAIFADKIETLKAAYVEQPGTRPIPGTPESVSPIAGPRGEQIIKPGTPETPGTPPTYKNLSLKDIHEQRIAFDTELNGKVYEKGARDLTLSDRIDKKIADTLRQVEDTQARYIATATKRPELYTNFKRANRKFQIVSDLQKGILRAESRQITQTTPGDAVKLGTFSKTGIANKALETLFPRETFDSLFSRSQVLSKARGNKPKGQLTTSSLDLGHRAANIATGIGRIPGEIVRGAARGIGRTGLGIAAASRAVSPLEEQYVGKREEKQSFVTPAKKVPPRIESRQPTKKPGGFKPISTKSYDLSGLSSDLVQAVIDTESSRNPNAEGPTTRFGTKAQGLMQLLPSTGQELANKAGIEYDPFDPKQNVMLGTKYLAQQLKQFKSLPLALAAYNAGPEALRRALKKAKTADWEQVVIYLPSETRKYVKKVLEKLGAGVNSEKEVDALSV